MNRSICRPSSSWVSEDLRGDSLDQRLAIGRFPPHEAARIARLAAIGLAQMHQCGRVHGDVRPASILLESLPNHPGNARLLFDPTQLPEPIDFTDQQSSSRLSLLADYLAPELAAPGRVPDPLSDIYALGCTLYAADGQSAVCRRQCPAKNGPPLG